MKRILLVVLALFCSLALASNASANRKTIVDALLITTAVVLVADVFTGYNHGPVYVGARWAPPPRRRHVVHHWAPPPRRNHVVHRWAPPPVVVIHHRDRHYRKHHKPPKRYHRKHW